MVAEARSTVSSDRAAPWVVDALLAATVAMLLALIMATHDGGARAVDAVAYLFAVVFGGLMLLRRRQPLGVLGVTVLALFAYYTLDYPPIGVALPVVAALFTEADADRLGWAIAAGAVVCGVSFAFRLRDGEPAGFLLGYELITNLALIAAALALGDSSRARRLQAAQQAQIARLIAEETARDMAARTQTEREAISRDLHDTVGHTASVIAVHAGVAQEALDRTPAAAQESLQHIRTASSRLSAELRDIVAVLRDHSQPQPDHGPISLTAADDLLDRARAAGLTTELHLDLGETSLPAAVDTTAYRNIQEAVTNVLRHADAQHIRITATATAGQLHLQIRDDGTTPPSATASGYGLQGMSDRALLLGGDLTTRFERGFVVEARLPISVPR
jgi:signal transduction histidine kinase